MTPLEQGAAQQGFLRAVRRSDAAQDVQWVRVGLGAGLSGTIRGVAEPRCRAVPRTWATSLEGEDNESGV